MKFFTLLLLCCLCPCLTLLAQVEPVDIKFGKVSEEDRALLSVPGDSTAEAYVLHDVLNLTIEPNVEGQPMLNEAHHRRIKLLTKAGLDRADVEIRYYKETERIHNLKAMIHFPDGGSAKLEKRNIIKEDYNDDYGVYKFTFPGVKEGVVIEYSYVKSDKNIVVPTRYFFQEDIPVRYAEYRALIPVIFDYVSLSNGRNKYDYELNESVVNNYGGISINHTNVRWVLTDLAAYDKQPYMNNFSDYIPQVRLQLGSVTYPSQPTQRLFTSWQETTEKMYDWSDFGRAFVSKSNSNKVFRDVEPLLAGATTEQEKASIIYNFVTARITWDGVYSWTAERTPNKVYEAATGNSGEMSVMLLALLRQAGIDAKPVLVPLRDYGTPVEVYPLVTQFDHLMVLAHLDGTYLFLDPNTPRRPLGLPRAAALNRRAFVADKENPQWVDVSGQKALQVVQAKMSLDAEGMADVSINSRLDSYYALQGRNAIADMEDDSDFPLMGDIMELFPDTELLDKSIADKDAKSGKLTFSMDLKVPVGQVIDDYLYIQPILCPVFEKNLADVEQRIYPVDFPYAHKHRYIANINVPEGYTVEEMPKSQRAVLPDGSITCSFSSNVGADNTINILFDVAVDKTFFPARDYEALRGMFRFIIEAQESTLVLKRAK